MDLKSLSSEQRKELAAQLKEEERQERNANKMKQRFCKNLPKRSLIKTLMSA